MLTPWLLRGERRAALLAMQRAAAAEHALLDHVGEADRSKIQMDLVAELFPEVRGETSGLAAAAAHRRSRRAARSADRLVDGEDDVGDPRLLGRVSQEVAAPRPAHASDQPGDAQLGEELLEIGERYLLPLGGLGKRDRVTLVVL